MHGPDERVDGAGQHRQRILGRVEPGAGWAPVGDRDHGEQTAVLESSPVYI